MATSTYLANSILDFVVGSSDTFVVTGLYLGAFTVVPGRTDPGQELSGDGYARVHLTSWGAATAGHVGLGTQSFPTATADWLPVNGWGVFDSVGHLLWYTSIPAPIRIANGQTLSTTVDLYID